MIKAGLSEEVVVAKIRQNRQAFNLTPDEMIDLKQAGATDNILKVMLDPQAEVRPAASPITPAMFAEPSVTSVVPSGSSTLMIATAVAPPSGATLTTAAGVSVNENDPNSPHDSGIYWFAEDAAAGPKMEVLERAAYQGGKSGGFFTSAMTMGIKKAKWKAVLQGNRASLRIPNAKPVFYFYFEDKSAGLGKSYFTLQGVSNPNQFALIRLDVKKSSRETTVMEMGAFGGSTGTDMKAMVAFKSERIRPGLYKVTLPADLQSGEYCFIASTASTGMAGGAMTATDIFDFGISME